MRPLSFQRNKSSLNSESDETGNIVNFEAIHQLRPMTFNRLHTNVQIQSDLFRRFALGD
jgi:hypothetical protein